MPPPDENDDLMPDNDLRADILATVEEAQADEPSTATTPTAAPSGAPEPAAVEGSPAETPEQAEARVRDEKGRFAKGEAAPAATPPAPAAPAAPAPTIRPPQSWRPDVREKFAALPPEVQAEVHRREREVDTALKESVQARRAIDELRAVTQPHLATLQAEGVTPAQGYANFLSTATMLRTGAPEVKARALANVIKQYGVDIDLLAAAIDGQVPAGTPAQPPRDPRVDDLLARINSAEQARRQQAVAAEEQAVEAFAASHEYFEDVRSEMADLIDLAARRGVVLSYDDAYNRAIAARPEISTVIRQREAAAATRNGQPSIARAKVAASSVRSRPVTSTPTPAPKEADDLRGAIEQAAQELMQR